jgi:hypothetical protein
LPTCPRSNSKRDPRRWRSRSSPKKASTLAIGWDGSHRQPCRWNRRQGTYGHRRVQCQGKAAAPRMSSNSPGASAVRVEAGLRPCQKYFVLGAPSGAKARVSSRAPDDECDFPKLAPEATVAATSCLRFRTGSMKHPVVPICLHTFSRSFALWRSPRPAANDCKPEAFGAFLKSASAEAIRSRLVAPGDERSPFVRSNANRRTKTTAHPRGPGRECAERRHLTRTS